METIGSKGMVFGTADEIRDAHPNAKSWGGPDGFRGDAVVLADGTQCISVFIGQGRAVLISAEGIYVRDDVVYLSHTHLSRVVDGAWVPKSLYVEAGGENDD